MDEYTLLIVAKLRADRQRLEREEAMEPVREQRAMELAREQRATPAQPERPHDRNEAHEYWPASLPALRRQLWREQS